MRIAKSPLIAGAIAVLAAGWIASGQIGNQANGAEQATAPNAQETTTPRMKVRVADMVAQPRMESVTITGRTEASRSVELRAETEGQIIELLARRGDAVAKKAVIARLRLDDRGAKLAEAKALRRQREIEFEATRKLHEKGFRSTTDQAASQAYLDAARAVVEQMEIDIARITLRAPFAGTISAGHVEVGDFVRIGAGSVRVAVSVPGGLLISTDQKCQPLQARLVTAVPSDEGLLYSLPSWGVRV